MFIDGSPTERFVVSSVFIRVRTQDGQKRKERVETDYELTYGALSKTCCHSGQKSK